MYNRSSAAILGGAYAGVIGSRTALMFGGIATAAAVLVVAALLVHLFSTFFRKAVSPSELLLFLLVVGTLTLW